MILQHYDPTDDLVLFQQDIAGFFNFVTHPRYAALQGLDLRGDPILSVAQHQQERLQRIFRGRWRKASRSYHPIHLCDLPALVSHLLDSSYFTVGLTVFRQCQVASMGSPLAPALRSAVALFREYCFLRSFPTSSWRYATGLALRARYVDNVFFLGPTHMLHTDSFKAIAQPFFYGRPLEMEYVTDETLLGFVLSTSQRTITYRQPPHLTLIRSNRTAGSPDMALAGLFTRGILICRLTRPRDLILPQLIDLTQQYLDKDFTMTQLLPLLHQLCHRFHLPRSPFCTHNVGFSLSHRMQHLGPIFALKYPLSSPRDCRFHLLLFSCLCPFLLSPHQRLGSNTLSTVLLRFLAHVSFDHFGSRLHHCDPAEHRHCGTSSFGRHDPKSGGGFTTCHDPKLLPSWTTGQSDFTCIPDYYETLYQLGTVCTFSTSVRSSITFIAG